MYNYKNLEKALNLSLSIKKGNITLYESPLVALNDQWSYDEGLYTITTSVSLTHDVLELIKIVIKNNEEVQPFWIRVLKQLPFDQSEIPTNYQKDVVMSVWLIKGNQLKDDIDLIEALFEHSHVFSVSSDNIIVICLDDEDVEPADIVAHIEVEAMKSIRLITGSKVNQLDELRTSYEKAMLIDRIVQNTEQSYVIYEDVLLESVIGIVNNEEGKELYDSYSQIYPIQGLTAELKETIYGFFKHNLNITDTANDLYLHRNTLIYRLNKIMQVSNLDIRNFEAACKMKILLLLDYNH